MIVRFAAFAAVGLLCLAGCGSQPEQGAKVTATLQKGGKPYEVREDEEVLLNLVPEDDAANLRGGNAQYDREKKVFIVPEGLAPGDYKIVLESHNEKYEDRFKEAFSEENTSLRYTVTADKEQAIVIDLGKKTVTKKS